MDRRHQLRQEREQRGWSQAKVADLIGTTELSISRWERGITHPQPYYRVRLAKLFGASEYALGLAEAPEEEALPSIPDERTPVPETALSGIVDPTLPRLPATPIVGREQDIARVKQRLRTDQTIVLTALHGLPGVGKTTLALCLTHDQEIRTTFSDGILWAGLGPEPTIREHLRRWGMLLGLSSSEMDALHQYRAWENALRVAIGTRRLLLVVDDVWNLADAWPFLVEGPHCAHLVTTRFPHLANQLVSDEATVIHELDTQQSVDLLGLLAPKAVVQERQKAQELAKVVGGLPLALTLMGHYLRQQSSDGQTRRIRAALDRLSDARARLHVSAWPPSIQRSRSASSEEMLSLQSAIHVSEQTLDARTCAALHALSVLPAKPESFSEEAACAVAQCAGETLDVLVDRGLLECMGPNRYTLHQTVADYARSRLEDPEPLRRLVVYGVHYVKAYEKDYERLGLERPLIQAALEGAWTCEMPEALVQGVCAFFPFLLAQGAYPFASQQVERAYEAAQARNDEHALLKVLICRGKLLQKQGYLAEAATCYQDGLHRARQLGDQEGICTLLNHLGWVMRKQGQYTHADSYLQEALQLARQAHLREAHCQALNFLSALSAGQGRYTESEQYAQEGLVLARQIGDADLIGFLLINLGVTIAAQGKDQQARAIFEEGLALARQIDHREWIGTLLINLGQVCVYLGHIAQARHAYQEGLDLAQQIGHTEWIGVVHLNLAELAIQEGRWQEAHAHIEHSRHQAQVLGRSHLLANVHQTLGNLALAQGHAAEAEQQFHAMAQVLPEQDPEIEALALFGHAQVAAAQGHLPQALVHAQVSAETLEAIGNRTALEVRQWMQLQCSG